FDLAGEIVKVRAENVPIQKCDKCGEVLSGPATASVRHEAVCRAAGLITPSEIKALRERFGWTQQQLADLTDFGIATVSRWEAGATSTEPEQQQGSRSHSRLSAVSRLPRSVPGVERREKQI